MSTPPPAYVTVTDAAGRVLFRRLATDSEVEEARQIAHDADAEAHDVLKAIAKDREHTAMAPPPAESEDIASAQAGIGDEEQKDILDSFAGLKVPKKEEEAPAFTDLGDDLDFSSLDGGGD